jgi:signal transduction histidine kinase
MIGIHLDVTDFIKLNEMNQQREKMEETFRFNIASQTLAAIAHELNQPLTAISYFADAAMDMVDADDLKSQKLCRVLENCSEQSQRAGQVIRQLLSLLQRAESVSENVDINQAVKSVYDLSRSNDQLKGCQLILNLGTDLPLVNSNDLQIQKVLITLISNAIESMQECPVQDRVLTITTGRSVNNPDLAQITVCDNGTGVTDAEMLNTIFNPFFTTKTTGLGMGLAISRSLIETYGGKMWAEQNADAGLSVHFTLPFAL